MGDDDAVVRIITSSWDSISNECIGVASKLVLNGVENVKVVFLLYWPQIKPWHDYY